MEAPQTDGLSEEEDDALRRLSYFADNAGLSKWSTTRLSELRSRDRRDEVRLPRELCVEEDEVEDTTDGAA